MIKRFVAALAAGLLVLAGCSAPEPESEPALEGTGSTVEDALTLNLHLGGEPSTIDPAYATADDGGSYVLHLFQGLTALDKNGKAAPAAAESWTVEEDDEGLPVYTFTLRPDGAWSDGAPVTAGDFVYAWTRVLDYEHPTPNAYELYPIRNAQRYHEGVPAAAEEGEASGEEAAITLQHSLTPEDLGLEAVDDTTLKVTLEGPCPDFLELLALPAWCPVRQSAVEANPDSWTQSAATCITNGPYLLKAWDHDQSLTLIINDRYGDTEAPAVLHFVLSDDAEALYNDFRAGRLQYASAIPTLDRPAMEESGRFSQVGRAGVYSYLFNTSKKPFDDARVRRAISLSIDREALAAAVGVDLLPAYGLVPNGIPDTLAGKDFAKVSPAIIARPSNLTEAQHLLSEAGYPGGAGFPQLRFITNDSPAHLTAAEEVRQQLAEKLGIDMAISALSTRDFQTARAGDGWDMARGGIVGSRMDPAPYLTGWSSGSAVNYGGFQSEDYDQLLLASYTAPETPPEEEEGSAEAESGSDADTGTEGEEEAETLVIPDTRMEILHAIETLLVGEEAVVVPLWQYQEPVLTAEGLRGVVASPLGYRLFQYAQWEPPVVEG